MYASTKFMIMANRQDTKQATIIQRNAFPSDQAYNAEELGFDFAFWLIHRTATSYSFISPEEAKEYLDVTLV